MASMDTAARGTGGPGGLRHHSRALRVIAGSEFRLKYAGSALGYVWSVLKPLASFTIIYLVFSHVFRLGAVSKYYPLSLLIGIVLFNFFADATTMGMTSLVARESLLRKMSFPRLIVPTSATLTAAMTLGVNMIPVLFFLLFTGIVPHPSWLLVIPLLFELYLFVLGIALILSALFVRLRDIGQVWELMLQLFLYGSPIIYPIGYLPPWLQKLVFINPFTQVLQDIRAAVLYPDLAPNKITAATAFGTSAGRLIPISIAVGTLVVGFVLFRREAPWIAERI
jgi:ABC-2 type transport system permease protein